MPLYYGRVAPYGKLDNFTNHFEFQEYIDRDNYVLNYTQKELEDTQDFLIRLLRNYQCSDSVFQDYKEYIRYLYKIATLSYLDFSLTQFEKTSKQIGWGGVCNYKLDTILAKCNPKTKNMRFFKESSLYLAKKRKKFILKYNETFEENRDEWFKNFNHEYQGDFTKQSLFSECGKGCDRNSKKLFEKMCDTTKKDFLMICNEKDTLYGMERVPEVYLSLLFSQALREMDKEVYNFKGCLRRFTEYYRDEEFVSSRLASLLNRAYSFKRKASNPLGELFDVSSLKTFLDMGVDSLFERPIASKKIIKEKPLEQKVILKKEVISKVEKAIVQLDLKKAKHEKKVQKKKKKISYFLNTYKNMVELDFDSISLDMAQFKLDYSFSPKVRSLLDKKMESFARRKTLKQMVEFDQLGSKKSPVPALFIKYLIDTQNHTGLFNLVGILGNRFYILNDIDDLEKKEVIKSQLYFNDERNLWEMSFFNTKRL
jgi:hypothetical protein